MLKEVERTIKRLKIILDGRAWHGPNFMQALNGVKAEESRKHPIENRHSIWEIVDHCTYWTNAVAEAFEGKMMSVYDSESMEDWPKKGKSEEEWSESKNGLIKAHEKLIKSLNSFDESNLDATVPGREFTYRLMLHGIVDHNLYHMGQIAVFREKK